MFISCHLNVYENWLSCPHVIFPYLLVIVWTAAQEIPDVSRISISNNIILGMCIMRVNCVYKYKCVVQSCTHKYASLKGGRHGKTFSFIKW